MKKINANSFQLSVIQSPTAKKKFILEDGKISTGGQFVSQGVVNTVSFNDLYELQETIETDCFTLIHGTLENDEDDLKVGTKQDFKNGLIDYARSKDFFAYRNEYSIVMLDLDDGKAEDWQGLDNMIADLRNTFPWLADVGLLAVPSSSNGWFYISDNQPLKTNGVCKWHIYLVIKSDLIDDFKQLMIDKAWDDGKGWIDLSKSGAMLVRQVFDSAVFSPERLDYTQKAEDTTGLLYHNPPQSRVFDGDRLDALPHNKWRKVAHDAIHAAKEAIEDKAIEVKKTYYKEKGLTDAEINSKLNFYKVNGYENEIIYPNQIIHTKHGDMLVNDYFTNYAQSDLDDGGYLPDPATGEANKAFLFKDSASPYKYSIKSYKNDLTYYIRKEEKQDIEVFHLEEDEYISDVYPDISQLTGNIYINAGCGTGKTFATAIQWDHTWLSSPLVIIAQQNTDAANQHGRNITGFNELDVNAENNIIVYDQMRDIAKSIAQGARLDFKDKYFVIDEAHSLFLDGYRKNALSYLETIIKADVFKGVIFLSGTSTPQDFGIKFDKHIYFKKKPKIKTFKTVWHKVCNDAKIYTLLVNIVNNYEKYDGISVLFNHKEKLSALQKVLNHIGISSLMITSEAESEEITKFKQDGILNHKVILGTSSIVEGININNKVDKVACFVMGEMNSERLEQFTNRWRNSKEYELIQFKSLDYSPENPFSIADVDMFDVIYQDNTTVVKYVDHVGKQLQSVIDDQFMPRGKKLAAMKAYNFCEAYEIDDLTLSFRKKPFISQGVWASLRIADERKEWIAKDRMKSYGYNASTYVEYVPTQTHDFVEEAIQTAHDEVLQSKWRYLKQYEETALPDNVKYLEDIEDKLVLCGLKLPDIPDVYDVKAVLFIKDFEKQLDAFYKEETEARKMAHFKHTFDSLLPTQPFFTGDEVVKLVEDFKQDLTNQGLLFPHRVKEFTPNSCIRVVREYANSKTTQKQVNGVRKRVYEINSKPNTARSYQWDL